MLKWQVNHDGTEYMLLEQSDAGTRQILAEVKQGADGVWRWSASKEGGEEVAGQESCSLGGCIHDAMEYAQINNHGPEVDARRDEAIMDIISFSDNMVDKRVRDRLQALAGKKSLEVKDKLLGILDDCTYAALTSDIVIAFIRNLWYDAGGTAAELAARNSKLDNPEYRKANKERFGWQCCPV